jgi:hypothetical protein
MAIFKKTMRYLLLLCSTVGTIFLLNVFFYWLDININQEKKQTIFLKTYKSLNLFLEKYGRKEYSKNSLNIAVFSNSHCEFLFDSSAQVNAINITLYGFDFNMLDNRLKALSSLRHFDAVIFCKDPGDFMLRTIKEPVFRVRSNRVRDTYGIVKSIFLGNIPFTRNYHKFILDRSQKYINSNLISYNLFLKSIDARYALHQHWMSLSELDSTIIRGGFYSILRSNLLEHNPCVIAIDSPLHSKYKSKIIVHDFQKNTYGGYYIKPDFALIEDFKSYRDGDHLNINHFNEFSALLEPKVIKVLKHKCSSL